MQSEHGHGDVFDHRLGNARLQHAHHEDDASRCWRALWSRPRAASRNLAPLDDTPVWSITCFVVAKRFRRQGLMRALIDGASALAAAHGARCVEAYPLDAARKLSSGELYVGRLSTFQAAGFVEVLRRAPTRPIVRRDVSPACPRS